MNISLFKEITALLKKIDPYILRYFEAFFGIIINKHNITNLTNIFLLSTPRSGSTWLLELLLTQNGFKSCNEPLDIRNPMVRRYLGINNWIDLYNHDFLKLIEKYFKKIISGKLKHLGSNPFDRNFKYLTYRIIFKLIHGCEDKIGWLNNNFNCKIIYLIRHPIAVSLSRKRFPRLLAFILSDYKKAFSKNQIDFSIKIIKKGSKLEKGVLSWCLQNSIPLRNIGKNFLAITYEQLVLEPEKVIKHIGNFLKINDLTPLYNRIPKPSWSVKGHSNIETETYLSENHIGNKREYLIKKWKKDISKKEEKESFKILKKFNIDIYKINNFLPDKKYFLE